MDFSKTLISKYSNNDGEEKKDFFHISVVINAIVFFVLFFHLDMIWLKTNYKYSKELMFYKILIVIDKKIGCKLLSQRIFNYIKEEKITHNLSTQIKREMNIPNSIIKQTIIFDMFIARLVTLSICIFLVTYQSIIWKDL